MLSAGVWNDYEKIYPDDEYRKEMEDGARVWRVYNDEAERIDREKLDDWKSTLDTQLIFVRLFCIFYTKYF